MVGSVAGDGGRSAAGEVLTRGPYACGDVSCVDITRGGKGSEERCPEIRPDSTACRLLLLLNTRGSSDFGDTR